MASRIQGITVEIGGNTTKLSKVLESVNKSIKDPAEGVLIKSLNSNELPPAYKVLSRITLTNGALYYII